MISLKNVAELAGRCAVCLLLIAVSHIVLAQARAQDLTAGPKLTQSEAILAARIFCREIGAPVTALGIATFPETKDPEALGDYWLPQWEVQFPGQAVVRIGDSNSVVTYYRNDELEKELIAVGTSSGSAVSQVDAVQSAQAALNATGTNTKDLDDATAFISVMDPSRNLAINHRWIVEWKRSFRGIHYLHQGASVGLDAETGQVILLEISLPSPPLTQATMNVTAQQAIAITQRHMIYDMGFQGYATLYQANLEIVQPNSGWSHFQDAPGHSWTARPAWIVKYCFTLADGREAEEDTWVDTQTGELLGHESGASSFGGSTAAAVQVSTISINKALPSVTAVYALHVDGTAKRGWTGVPSAAITAKAQPTQIALLKKATPAPAPPPSSAATYQLVLVDKDNSLSIYGYDATDGLLGSGTDWVSVPPKLKAWLMQKLAKGAATQQTVRAGEKAASAVVK